MENNNDDWGRDGDLSMPNGPHGDEENKKQEKK